MMRIFELTPVDGRKSFNSKCKVIEYEDGRKVLLSYNTQVAQIDGAGVYSRLWDGSSQITTRHIKAFKAFYNIV